MEPTDPAAKPIRADLPADAHDQLVAIQDAIATALGVGAVPRAAALAHIIRRTDPREAAATYVAYLQARADADHAREDAPPTADTEDPSCTTS